MFRVPTFNLTCNVWRSTTPVINPPDLSPTCQLRAAGKQSTGQDVSQDWVFLWSILFPANTDVRDAISPGGADTIECPAGSKRYYSTAMVDDVAKGFANEYRTAFVLKLAPWPAPIP